MSVAPVWLSKWATHKFPLWGGNSTEFFRMLVCSLVQQKQTEEEGEGEMLRPLVTLCGVSPPGNSTCWSQHSSQPRRGTGQKPSEVRLHACTGHRSGAVFCFHYYMIKSNNHTPFSSRNILRSDINTGQYICNLCIWSYEIASPWERKRLCCYLLYSVWTWSLQATVHSLWPGASQIKAKQWRWRKQAPDWLFPGQLTGHIHTLWNLCKHWYAASLWKIKKMYR